MSNAKSRVRRQAVSVDSALGALLGCRAARGWPPESWCSASSRQASE
jgi:hypothetical protein